VEVPIQSHESVPSARAEALKAKWICIPFFSLKPYSGLSSASITALFPDQTLLQTLHSEYPAWRDEQQVVCKERAKSPKSRFGRQKEHVAGKLGIESQSECFHVEQLWCLVLGNSR
jgi:hypothetical protein